MSLHSIRALGIAAALAIVVESTAAHELVVPEQVYADANGNFTYQVQLTVTSPIEYGGMSVDGTNNTSIGQQWGDGFCAVIREAGVYSSSVQGHLLDPSQSGSVIYHEFLCDGWQDTRTTTIVPAPVAEARSSWSAVKARYR